MWYKICSSVFLIATFVAIILVNPPKLTILVSSKLRKVTDDNFKVDEKGRKFSKGVENTVGKGEIARYELFQKTCTADT